MSTDTTMYVLMVVRLMNKTDEHLHEMHVRFLCTISIEWT